MWLNNNNESSSFSDIAGMLYYLRVMFVVRLEDSK